MSNTIENTHNKITDKISRLQKILDDLNGIDLGLDIIGITNRVTSIEKSYCLEVLPTMARYYIDASAEKINTKEYQRTIISGNYVSDLDSIINILTKRLDYMIVKIRCKRKSINSELLKTISDLLDRLEICKRISIEKTITKRNYEICKCGSRMTLFPETSELQCSCGYVKQVVGVAFRNDQFYVQDGQKSRHGGYDTSRHYKFWIERLQALETKIFEQSDLDKIEYVIKRDSYIRKLLTCKDMRVILKNPKVNATHLNDHVPLLVKMFGGNPPPILTFKENRILSTRFKHAMRLYDLVNPVGGNKPYYPYFIYKLIEEKFKNNSEKLRLLNYIHLQSRETIIKNDKHFEQMCKIAGDVEGLVYRPTDPAGRF
jgi:hypothetical protein